MTIPLTGAGPSAGLGFPSGATILAPFDKFDITTAAVPNLAAASQALSTNLFRGSRRQFANGTYWGGQNRTCVDDAATDPYGGTEASTLASTSGNWVNSPLGGTTAKITAGTYTQAITVARNDVTDQSFAFTSNFTATRVNPQTATSAYQRFTSTFTLGADTNANNIGICSVDGSTGAKLKIIDHNLYAGSSDLGPAFPDGNIYLGSTKFDTRVVAGTGYVDLSAVGYGLYQPVDAFTTGSVTAQCVCATVGSGASYVGFLSKPTNYAQFSAMLERSGVPCAFIPDGSLNTIATGLWPLNGAGYHVITLRYDTVTGAQEIFLDDVRLYYNVAALSATSVRDLYINIVNSTSLYGRVRYAGIGLWQRALSDAEIRSSVEVWRTRLALSGLTLNDATTRFVAFDGDSRSAQAVMWPYVMGPNTSPRVFGTDFASNGSSLTDLIARETFFNSVIPPNKNGRKFYAMMGEMGANDLGTYPGATDTIAATAYVAAQAGIVDAWINGGYDAAVVMTEGPVSGATTHNARRAISNNLIKTAWPGAHSITVADAASDPIMGTDTSFTDHPTDWTDGTHPNLAGSTLLEPYERTAINGLP